MVWLPWVSITLETLAVRMSVAHEIPEMSSRTLLAFIRLRPRSSKSLMVRFISFRHFHGEPTDQELLRAEGSYDARVQPHRLKHQEDYWHGFSSQALASVRS